MPVLVQACTGRANPTVNKTPRRHVGMEGTTLLFAAHKPTTKKTGKDKYPFKHPQLDTLRNVVDSKSAMSLPNYSLTSHSPCRWKPELVGLTTPVLMESEASVLPIPMCHALLLIGTSKPVKQVDVFWEVNEEPWELGQTGHVFKEQFAAKDGDMLANMKIEVDNVGLTWGGIFNVASPSPNSPSTPGGRAAVYGVPPGITFMCATAYLLKTGISLANVDVKNNMRGRCLCRPRVSRRGLTIVLNMETLDPGLRH